MRGDGFVVIIGIRGNLLVVMNGNLKIESRKNTYNTPKKANYCLFKKPQALLRNSYLFSAHFLSASSGFTLILQPSLSGKTAVPKLAGSWPWMPYPG